MLFFFCVLHRIVQVTSQGLVHVSGWWWWTERGTGAQEAQRISGETQYLAPGNSNTCGRILGKEQNARARERHKTRQGKTIQMQTIRQRQKVSVPHEIEHENRSCVEVMRGKAATRHRPNVQQDQTQRWGSPSDVTLGVHNSAARTNCSCTWTLLWLGVARPMGVWGGLPCGCGCLGWQQDQLVPRWSCVVQAVIASRPFLLLQGCPCHLR